MKRIPKSAWIILIIIVIGLTASCIAWLRWRDRKLNGLEPLTNTDHYELLSINPGLGLFGSEFHNRKILGSLEITDPVTREQLTSALQSAARESNGEIMACFNPRHAISVTKAGVTTDFVICFECRQIEVWRDQKNIKLIPISDSPKSLFNEILTKANVPLAPQHPTSSSD